MDIADLEVYRIARELSRSSWKIFQAMDWHDQKIIGDQWIRSIDSVGANISEGFGRFHYLDKNKFYYNARGSLSEYQHWSVLMHERGKIGEDFFQRIQTQTKQLMIKLNNLITATKSKSNS